MPTLHDAQSSRRKARHVFAEGGVLWPKRAFIRVLASIVAGAVVAGALVVGAVVAPATADTLVSLEATSDSTILAGETASISLTATGSASTDLYNVAFRYELPAGVTYVAGSASGADAIGMPEPTIVTIVDQAGPPAITHQVLIWSNLADLPRNLAATLTFTVQPDPAVYPVGSSFSGQASVYAPSNPRKIVKFNSTTGVAVADASIASDATTGGTTKINAIEVEKSEPSPEHELMRGVHDQTTTYTLTVRNTGVAATDDVVVVDYLPAGLEFLGCGGVDNGTSGEEYPGSGQLGVALPVPAAQCLPAGTSLTKVETVQLAANEVGKLGAGVYTKVTWNVGTVLPGTTSSITYAAGIPLRENALWTGTAPGAESLAQASNLDNNTGPSTRQQEPAKAGQALTNTVVATGNYTGAVAPGSDRVVTASDSLTVRAMDLSIVKSVSTAAGDGSFTSGKLAEFTLLLRASEYTDDSAMTVTDIIPNGLCPLVPGGVSGNECQAANTITGATVVSTTKNSDGTYTLVMEPILAGGTLLANTSHTITYQALMGATYEGTSTPGTGADVPTAVGDSFTNTVSIAGTTTDVTAAQSPAVVAVTDDSKAAIVPTAPTINKRVLTRPIANGAALDCANPPSPSVYTDADVPGYQLGDTVCFELTVNFSSSAVTRNAVITDFVPVGTTYVGYSVDPTFTPAVVAVSGTEAATGAGAGTDPAAWHLGDRDAEGNRFVPMGEKLTMYVKAVVTDASAIADVDITANLMKYRQENTAGTVFALRDAADYSITTPRLSLNKSYVAPSGTSTVAEGHVVPFTLTVKNDGTAGKDHDFAVENIDLWDVLPVGLKCSTVSATVPAATCFDYGDAGYRANALASSSTPRSIVIWTIPGPILPGKSVSVTYNVTIPAQVSVSTVFTNNASVVKFTSANTSGTNTEYFPTDSLDSSTVTKPKWNVPAANAAATVKLADASVAKTATPNLSIANKSATQVVAGETVDYTYSVTVPAGTTVYNGLLSDLLPAGLTLPSSQGISAAMDGGALPGGFTLSDGNLTFPTVWNNTTTTDQVFTVTIAGALVGVGLSAGDLKNTATFTSSTDATGNTALPDRTASATVSVVVPKPTLSKAIDKTSARGGDIVTYTLVAGNTGGAPSAFDAVVVDCLPAGLTLEEFISPAASAATTDTPGTGTGSGGNGCAIGSTKLSWTLPTPGELLFPGTVTITFSAKISTSSVGLASYANVATVTGSTVSNGMNDGSVEKIVSATSNAATVAVVGATTVKAVNKPTATIGETVDYQIDVTIPAYVRFFNAAIIDTLPSGITASSAVVTCVQAGGACSGMQADGTALAPSTDGTKIGWLLGSVESESTERVVTVKFTGTVTSLAGNTAGTVRENKASLVWNTVEKGNPTSAGGSPDEVGTPGTAAITITEPKLSIAKSANNTTPEPGELVTYTVRVANANLATTSAAHNATVVDTVPAGIDISTVTLTSGSGVVNTTARTITWSIASLGIGASTTFTYTAKLAASPNLGTASIVNTVTVPSYSSLASGGREYTESPSATATVTPDFPNVTVAKTVTAGSIAYVGSPFGWSVTLTNTGRGTAATVTATDRLPKNWTYTAGSGTVSVNGATALPLTDPVVATASGVQTLTWAAFPNLAAGHSIVINYTATPTNAALSDPGAGTGLVHTNVISAVATDATGAIGNVATDYAKDSASAQARINEADVAIVKTAGSALVAGTATASAWTLTVSNRGPDTAVGAVDGGNFVVTDTPTLPAGVTITGASGTGWSCTPITSTGAFNCARTNAADTLASGASFPVITVAATTTASVVGGTSVPNSATVAAKTHDSTSSNNTDDDPNAVSTRADLAINKSITTTAPVAGGSITWSLAPSNAGPSVSRGVITVTDVVPVGVNSALATGTGWECDAQPADAGETISCDYTANGGAMPVGAAGTLTVTGTIDSSYVGGAISNTAQINPGTTTDPTPANNTASVTSVTPSTATTVRVEKSLVSPTPALIPGDEAVYDISVTNTGTADARVVTVTDVLPTGMTYSSKKDVTGVWTCTGTTTVSCALAGTLSALAPKNTATVRLHVATASNLPTTTPIVNTAVAAAANAPASSGSTSTGLVGKADLSIAKSHTGAVVAGTSLDYSLVVTNNGPSDSPATITVTDSVPAGLTPTVATGTGWDCVIGAPDPTTKLTQVTCEHDTMLAASAVADAITITVAIPADLAAQTLVNTASVDGPLDDPTPSNNTATDPATITTVAALDITKDVASSGPFIAGTTVDYTVRVTNSGPSVANLVSVSDVVPTGLSVTAITGVGWTCSVSTATCDRAVLPLGSYDVTVTALIDSAVADGTVLTNQAVLTWTDTAGSHTDDDPADVTVAARADLALAKTAVDASAKAVVLFNAGEQGRYLLQATNQGPSVAIAPLQITDQLPVGLSYLGLEDSLDWACVAGPIDASGQTVDCSWAGTAALAAGAAAHPLTMLVQVDASMAAGAVTNTATVSSPTVDDDPASNTDDETVTIVQLADLSITKTHSGSVRIGDGLAFDLEVRNGGPSVATGVVVTDTLPVGLEFVDAAGSDPAWSCVAATADANGTAVTCELTADVAPGDTAPALILTAIVRPAAYPTVVNIATVASTTPDADQANNTAEDSVTVPALASLTVTKHSTGTFRVGETGNYRITVSNAGPTENPDAIVVTDVLPDGLTFASVQGDGVECAAKGQTVSCTTDRPLAVGDTVTVDLTVNVREAAYPSVTNTVTVESKTEQAPDARLADSDTTGVAQAAPLAHTGVSLALPLLAAILSLLLGAGMLLRRRGRLS